MQRCSQPGCRIAETGVCLEGHKQNCPHLIAADSPVLALEDKSAVASRAISSAAEPRLFHTGEKLTLQEAARLMNERPARIVLCAGASKSGKTTFLARLCELFRNGFFKSHGFVGSLTLCAFEQATWFATMDSGGTQPDTKRTFRTENDKFLHLHVRSQEDPSDEIDLLISDLAGETYPVAVASGEFCTNLRSIFRADYLLVFLDCAKIVDRNSRHAEVDNARTFLQRVATVRHQTRMPSVCVVFSRSDYLENTTDSADHVGYCAQVEKDLNSRFSAVFGHLEFVRVAARPKDGGKPSNEEIMSLFRTWAAPMTALSLGAIPRKQEYARDFSAFGLL